MSYHSSKRHKTLKRDKELQNKFGINLPTYDKIIEEQGGGCAICGDASKITLAVDHCHETGRVRGLLCGKCNRALGLLRDNPDIIKKALKYLTREYIIQSENDIERKTSDEWVRWRYIVTTPEGMFVGFTKAGEHYDVHPTTLGAWCGHSSYLKDGRGKDRSSEGFSYIPKKVTLKEAQDIIKNGKDNN